MMRRCVALILFTLAAFANANVTIPPSFFGINIGSDPTAGGYVWPRVPTGGCVRIWDTPVGGTNAIPKWGSIATSNGVYSWTNFDAQLAAAQVNKACVLYTFGKVPTWVNSTNNLATTSQKQNFYDFVTALVAHDGANIQQWEQWNEFNYGTTWWVGSDATMIAMSQAVYPIIKTPYPNAIVMSPSIEVSSDTSGNTIPITPFYHWDQYLAGCHSGGLPCFDWLNVHSYPGMVAESVVDMQIKTAPELWPTMYNTIMAVATNDGFGSYPLSADEGNAGISGVDNTTLFNTDLMAGTQARHIILLASSGVVQENYFVYGTECTNQLTCGSAILPITSSAVGLNNTGIAIRNISGWLSGATFTTPMARVTTANSIRAAANNASTVGLLAGPGGCAGGVDTAGALPVHWFFSNNEASHGMSFYVVGSGTESSIPYIDVRVCGNDTTSGSGTKSISMTYDNSIVSTTGQNWVVGQYLSLPAGSLANIYQIQLIQSEDTSGGSYLADTHYYGAYPVNQPLANQHLEFRSRTDNASVGLMEPQISFVFYYNGNGTTGTLPIDATFRIGMPTAETGGNSTQWIGNITETNGTLGIIAWDASGNSSSYTTPNGYNTYRDIYGVQHTIVGNTVILTNMPIIIENASWKGLVL
jgi:hypothetical protein